MEPKLGGLKRRIEEFLQDRAELERAYASGGEASLPLPRLFHAYPELARLDTFHEAREALEGQVQGTPGHQRLSRLCLLLVQLAVEARSAETEAARAKWEVTSLPWPEEPGLVFADALRRLPHEPNRGRRALLDRAVTRQLETHEPLYARKVDALHQVAGQLELGSPLEAYTRFGGLDLAKLEQQAEAFLARTEDAYRDLLAYAVRRTEPSLRFTQVERHDLDRALLAPWAFAHTGSAELSRASKRWMEGWSLADGAGRLELDGADLPGKPAFPSLVATRVPERISCHLRLEVGLVDGLALLRAQGAGLSLALRDARLPFEDRRLEPGRAPALFGALFARMLTDPRWLERYLEVSRATSRELARLFAFAEVTAQREACARLSYEVELYRRGAGPELREVYEDRLRGALRVAIPPGRFLFGLSPHLAVAYQLQGAALAGAVVPALRERFDEDHWRNPHAAAFLRDVAAGGAAPESLGAVLPAPEEASLAASANELIAVMGA